MSLEEALYLCNLKEKLHQVQSESSFSLLNEFSQKTKADLDLKIYAESQYAGFTAQLTVLGETYTTTGHARKDLAKEAVSYLASEHLLATNPLFLEPYSSHFIAVLNNLAMSNSYIKNYK